MNPPLQTEIARRYGFQLPGDWTRIINGDECTIWRVTANVGELIVRISPAWRTEAELRWVHSLTRHCAATIPEVVAPISAQDGSTLFLFNDKSVSLYPYIEGVSLNTENAELRATAAHLLARIHATAQTWEEHGPRPSSRSTVPQPLPPAQYPPELVDHDLDAWHNSLLSLTTLTVGPMHGDYYERNILCRDDRICGVIDWDECRVGPLILETGWCVWEFCQDHERDDLNAVWAQAFLQSYMAAAGPLREAELAHVIPAIRWRLRNEAVHDLAAREQGEAWDADYTGRGIRAFQQLKGRALQGG